MGPLEMLNIKNCSAQIIPLLLNTDVYKIFNWKVQARDKCVTHRQQSTGEEILEHNKFESNCSYSKFL